MMINLFNQRCFLVDLDNVLIDLEKASAYHMQQFSDLTQNTINDVTYWSIYNQIRTELGHANIEEVARRLAAIGRITFETALNVYMNTPFDKFLMSGALNFLQRLKELGRVVIFTEAGLSPDYQKQKVEKSGLLQLIDWENIEIRKDKKDYLPAIFHELQECGVTQIFVIDDKTEVLDAAPDIEGLIIHRIHFQFGIHKDRRSAQPEKIEFSAQTLEGIQSYLSTHNAPEAQIHSPVARERI